MSNKAVALGLFDGLHLGHASVLDAALGSVGAVVNDGNDGNDGDSAAITESLVFTFGDTTPLPKAMLRPGSHIITNAQKLLLLSRMGFDDIYECDFAEVSGLTADEFAKQYLVKRFSAKIAACGSNFKLGSDSKTALQFKTICKDYGIKLIIVPVVSVFGREVSSTVIRAAILAGNIVKANQLLGYNLFYELPIVQGQKLARTLGTPTINQLLPGELIKPLYGVYESHVVLRGVSYRGVTNIGVKPTVTSDDVVFIETHMLDYDGAEAYGEVANVSLLRFIREERKWATVVQLKHAITADIKAVRAGIV